jgi:hypothetical protein
MIAVGVQATLEQIGRQGLLSEHCNTATREKGGSAMSAQQGSRLTFVLGFFAMLATLTGQSPTAVVASALTIGLLAAAFLHARAAVAQAGSAKAATWAASVRELARHTAFLPQRDPDAAGKPRPRAPGADPATG